GPQTGNDWEWFPDAGNGILTNGQYVTNDPNDADIPADSTYQQGLVQHEVSTFGPASKGGLRYYILDNEPSIWFSTHRDVHPIGPAMSEVESKIVEYSAMIKGSDPTALIVAPEEWGWSGYFYSGYDQQYGAEHGWSNLPDRAAHGGMDYLPWVLQQLHQNDAVTGKRTLDVFSVHYYPQGGEFSDDTSEQTDLLRNRSTRSLWDPNYVDESWINSVVELIPRLQNWVSAYYPGTLTAVTEYNWGAEGDINGATAQADILGIFGREGLGMATRWTTPDSTTPTYNAIKMYRNYDGQQSTFGDTSVLDTVPDPDNLSSFAAIRSSDGALTIMLVNKVLSGNTPVTVNLANFIGTGQAQMWQLTSANTINQLSTLNYSGGSLSLMLPLQSITLLVLPPEAALPPSAPSSLVAKAKSATVTLKWENNSTTQAGVYIEREAASGGSYATIGQVSGTAAEFSQTVAKGKYNYRVQAFGASGAVSGYSNVATVKVK
ncbi:MAG TPA: glycoside hydrolase family 44 protein, partial [Blastocatellia bacterium]